MRIRIQQTFMFRDHGDLSPKQRTHRVEARNETQEVPDWITKDPAFDLMIDSGHLEIVQSRARTAKTPDAASFGLAGGASAQAAADAAADKQEAIENSRAAAERIRLEQQVEESQKKAERDFRSGEAIDEAQGSGSEKYGGADWTANGQDVDGFPVEKGSPEDVTATDDERKAYAKAAKAKK